MCIAVRQALKGRRLRGSMVETTIVPVVVKRAVGSAAPQQGVFKWSQQLNFGRIIGHANGECQRGCLVPAAYWRPTNAGHTGLKGWVHCLVKHAAASNCL